MDIGSVGNMLHGEVGSLSQQCGIAAPQFLAALPREMPILALAIGNLDIGIILRQRQGGKELWRGYSALLGKAANFAMKQVAGRGDIHPVFRELFARQHHKSAVK